MTGYDMKYYEAQLPSIVRSLRSIAESLDKIKETIVSDPGDEVEHIVHAKKSTKEWSNCVICNKEYVGFGNNAEPVAQGRCCDECNRTTVIVKRLGNTLPDDYKMD
jgi:hypothetical protein